AIGAHNNDGNGTEAGHVRIYNWDGSSWTQVGNDIDGEAASDRSGHSVSLSSRLGERKVAIGAPFADDGNGIAGHVRIYHSPNATTAINELNSLKRKLLEVVDILGRNAKRTKNEPLFYIYDDGSVEKKIIIE
ncbi:MAG TPA: hypothetical protein QGG91_01810, partial [Flavobacteriales bacterium]|nr:hypothetical protein [Flavobacteriales bacterium]